MRLRWNAWKLKLIPDCSYSCFSHSSRKQPQSSACSDEWGLRVYVYENSDQATRGRIFLEEQVSAYVFFSCCFVNSWLYEYLLRPEKCFSRSVTWQTWRIEWIRVQHESLCVRPRLTGGQASEKNAILFDKAQTARRFRTIWPSSHHHQHTELKIGTNRELSRWVQVSNVNNIGQARSLLRLKMRVYSSACTRLF